MNYFNLEYEIFKEERNLFPYFVDSPFLHRAIKNRLNAHSAFIGLITSKIYELSQLLVQFTPF